MEASKIIRMGYSIQAFLVANGLDQAKPKDMMPWLIERGYFKSDHRAGLPLRNMLRDLGERNKLHLLPNLEVDRKDKNRFWRFVRLRD